MKALGIMFSGAAVTRNLFFALQACEPMLHGRAGETIVNIQKEFGRKVISKGYTKLYNQALLCKKVVAKRPGSIVAPEFFTCRSIILQ